MNDEFLYSIRRQPPSAFATTLKRQLQSQDAQRERRSRWLRFRTVLFLIAGSAVAGGLLILDGQPAEKAEPSSSPGTQTTGEIAPSSADRRAMSASRFAPNDSGGGVPAAPSAQTQSAVANDEGAPMPEVATVAAQSAPDPVIGGGLSRGPFNRVKLGASSLTHLLTRSALDALGARLSVAVPKPEIMEATAAFEGLCAAAAQLDIVMVSRRMTQSEFAACRRNGVARILESKLGYQALVLTSGVAGTPIKLAMRDVYLAMAKQIPDPADPTTFITNPNITWDQVDHHLQARSIGLFGPARETPLRALFETLVLEPGCNSYDHLKALQNADPESHAELCRSLRTDRRYWEVEQTASLIPQYLWAEPDALVLIDYSFYREHRNDLGNSAVAGPEPSAASFEDGAYPLARPVYLYANMSRIERSGAAKLILHELLAWPPPRGRHPFGFVRLGEQENQSPQERQRTILSESDLVTPRSEPR